MSELAMVGIDLGKNSFHLHGQDKTGREVFRGLAPTKPDTNSPLN
jgi:hypothetical protein